MRKPAGLSIGSRWEIVDGRDALQRGALGSELAPVNSDHSKSYLQAARITLQHRAWVEIPLGNGEWTTAARLLPQNGVPVIAELRIFPHVPSARQGPGQWGEEFAGLRAKVPPGGISTRLLRGLRLSLTGSAWKQFREAMQKLAGKDDWVEKSHGLSVAAPEAKRAYRRGRPDSFYALVAKRYCKVIESGKRNPVQKIAHSIGESESKVRDMILQARKRGLLTRPPKQGRIGGLLTPKGQALLGTKTKRQKPMKRR